MDGLLPVDLSARLRMLSESVVGPVRAVQPLPTDGPELALGQRFSAQIEGALADGSYRALVAGRSLTLALPQTAQPGDVLELVVTGRKGPLVIAEQLGSANAAVASGSSPTTFSRTAQLIASLLSGGGQPAQSASLSGSAPLLSAAPATGLATLLAPALRQAVVESGLFYEAHQAQWLAGRYTLDALKREPQAGLRHSATSSFSASSAATSAASSASAETASATASRAATALLADLSSELPAELRPLVMQQLNAAATTQLVWQGQLWPGQPLHWEIAEEPGEDAPDSGAEGGEANADDEPARRWTSRLVLELPNLGPIQVELAFSPEKVSLGITAQAQGQAPLQQGFAELVAAFAAAGLPLPAVRWASPTANEPPLDAAENDALNEDGHHEPA